MLLRLLLLTCLASTALSGVHTGCQKRLKKICPGAMTTDTKAQCVACVHANFQKLKRNCTLQRALAKCDQSPVPRPLPPQPPAPPCPPVAPAAGAPQPHIVLFVIDDQGWANVGYHNPGNVITPNSDRLAKEGIRLERHYAFRWCAPSRSALMTGRLPYHVLENTNYVTRGMTMLPKKLQSVGYTTHMVGKWHLGDTVNWMTPYSRGFNTSLGYLAGGEDHYTQLQSGEAGCPGVDLWQTNAPAYGKNGTYAAFTYNEELEKIIKNHPNPKKNPLFLYVATQTMHAPQEVPSFYSNPYSSKGYDLDYSIMNGMATVSDSILGNITNELKKKEMWNNTLFIHVSDNGGPAGRLSSGHSGNNWPLRGGKTNNFEGGVRVASFLTGGFLTNNVMQQRIGSELHGYIHLADWYPTLSFLAGTFLKLFILITVALPHQIFIIPGIVKSYDKYELVHGLFFFSIVFYFFYKTTGANPNDVPSIIPNSTIQVPPVDGFNLWPYLSGQNDVSPRTDIMLSSEDNGALISGHLKIIFGLQTYGFWQSPIYPNASTDHSKETEYDCGMTGCLFNITSDPSEYENLADSEPMLLQQMTKLYQQKNATKFWLKRVQVDAAKCAAKRDERGGFLGPYF